MGSWLCLLVATGAVGSDQSYLYQPAFSMDYELREPQVEMARAVAQTLDRRSRLLVEAGTGVGKSLAYLVPLALWSPFLVSVAAIPSRIGAA